MEIAQQSDLEAESPCTAEGVSAFLEGLKQRGPPLSDLHRKSLARKATDFGHLGERMSQGQAPLLETDFHSHMHVRSGQRPVPVFIMEVVADLDGKEEVSMEDVRGFARRLVVLGRPSSSPEWDPMHYWTCFVLSVLGREEGSKLKQLSVIGLRDDEWLALAVNLISNSRLEILSLQGVWFLREASDPKWVTALGAHCVAEAVRLNRVLHSLYCTFECVTLKPRRVSMQLSGAETVTPYLEALTPGLDGSHPTSSIRMFTLGLLSGGTTSQSTIALGGDARREVGRALGTMISRNKTLTGLTLSGISFEEPLWLESLIPELKMNAFLKVLDLKGSVFSVSSGIEALKEAFTDLLQSTNVGGLEEINLQGTALDLYAGQLKEILRKKWAYRGKFQEQVQAPPTCGRIVLCGYQYAGKTTLCETMVRSSRHGSHRSFSQRWRRATEKFMIRHPRLRRLLFGSPKN